MRRFRADLLLTAILAAILSVTAVMASGLGGGTMYFPFIAQIVPPPPPRPTPPPTPMPSPTLPPGGKVEFRGLWVTRFNWTGPFTDEEPADIHQIVDDAHFAGFNAILFQVRGEADAFYTPGLEPWSERLAGLGQSPGWDPLQVMIERAHGYGMQVHAYFNVYPVSNCNPPSESINPRPLYHLLIDEHFTTNGKPNGLQWTQSGDVVCSDNYRMGSPASLFLDDHMIAVATDIVKRYDIDGLHLDRIRYAGSGTSCDPVSAERSGVPCFSVPPSGYASYQDWQRAQVNGTVNRFYETLFGDNGQGGVADKPNFMLSAAVWPYYESGRNNLYQDSRAWLAGGYIDALMPMLYGSFDTSPAVWKDYAAGFQNASAGRYVIPGMHGCCYAAQAGTFDDIAQRIQAARDLGTAGHAIFAYNYLKDGEYFDDLRAGPYADPAIPPPIPWHP